TVARKPFVQKGSSLKMSRTSASSFASMIQRPPSGLSVGISRSEPGTSTRSLLSSRNLRCAANSLSRVALTFGLSSNCTMYSMFVLSKSSRVGVRRSMLRVRRAVHAARDFAEHGLIRAHRTLDDGIVVLDQLLAELRERCAAARFAAGPGRDERFREQLVELVDEQPRAPIRHLHRARGARDRLLRADLAQQVDLAGADLADAGQVHLDPELGGRRLRHALSVAVRNCAE